MIPKFITDLAPHPDCTNAADNPDLRQLIEEYLSTLDTERHYWGGMLCSDKEMAESILISGRVGMLSFFYWLLDKDQKQSNEP